MGVAGNGDDADHLARGLKMRLVWMISTLIAKHYLLKEVVKVQKCLRRLVLRDKKGEGMLVVMKVRLKEWREENEEDEEEEEEDDNDEERRERNETKVSSMKIKMRHKIRVELHGGVSGGYDVGGGEAQFWKQERRWRYSGGGNERQHEMAREAFGGVATVYEEVVQVILQGQSYVLEMNSF
ncbi:hypothetical protein FNV43_RR10972 [Rhamnella rubrinervis]|uniref:Uncharacterized protein n=1 Tax=Rhamnella rubrinervis TaxID=2594499 RepID=A0A8K0H4Y1_9ROSA|nr:hypothetical protein FNV43_RR10972 [Rhamnella rubrinervis]